MRRLVAPVVLALVSTACGGSTADSTTIPAVTTIPPPTTTSTVAPTTTSLSATTSTTSTMATTTTTDAGPEPIPFPPLAETVPDYAPPSIVWVSYDDTVVAVDVVESAVVAETVVGEVSDLDVGAGAVWAASCSEGTVTMLSQRTLAVLARWDIGGCPHLVTADRTTVFIADSDAGIVWTLDPTDSEAPPVAALERQVAAMDAGSLLLAEPGGSIHYWGDADPSVGPTWSTTFLGTPIAAVETWDLFGPLLLVLVEPDGFPPYVVMLDAIDGSLVDSWDMTMEEASFMIAYSWAFLVGDPMGGALGFDFGGSESFTDLPPLSAGAYSYGIGGMPGVSVASGATLYSMMVGGTDPSSSVTVPGPITDVAGPAPPRPCGEDDQIREAKSGIIATLFSLGVVYGGWLDDGGPSVGYLRFLADRAADPDTKMLQLLMIEEIEGHLAQIAWDLVSVSTLTEWLGESCDLDVLLLLQREIDAVSARLGESVDAVRALESQIWDLDTSLGM